MVKMVQHYREEMVKERMVMVVVEVGMVVELMEVQEAQAAQVLLSSHTQAHNNLQVEL